MRVDILVDEAAWKSKPLKEAWERICEDQIHGVFNFDMTAGFDWARSLWEVHLGGKGAEVLVARAGSEIVGILPVYRQRSRIRRLPVRMVAPLTYLNSGRDGFLLRNQDAETLEALFAHLCNGKPGCDVFAVRVVHRAGYEQLLEEVGARIGLRVRCIKREESPFIELKDSWEAHFASLPKKLRYTMRSGEQRLRERGELVYRECWQPSDVEYFNAAVREIELASWKQVAGTSLTANPVQERFHQVMIRHAAEAGSFSGHLLLLNGKPIAYMLGLIAGSVFHDLKNTYSDAVREFSPSHVLMNLALPSLLARQVRLFDFMGACDDYKMRWTDKTFTRGSYLVFNRTVRGRLAAWLQGMGASALGKNRDVAAE